MIESLSIRNFQSLQHVDLDLSPFTVIVGQSSSGKSALVRAIKTLTANRRGLDFLTHGTTVCTITARTENGSVTLSRGKATDDNSYTLDMHEFSGPQRFTKLGAATPVEVSAFLGIDGDKEAINYAGQHDKPFMLDNSASTNASILGRLTNVDVIFSAARESNRQKLDATKTLGLRVSDLDSIKERAKGYASLAGQNAALGTAEESLSEAYRLSKDIERIKAAWDSYKVSNAALERLQAVSEVPVPSVDTVLEAQSALQGFRTAQNDLTAAVVDLKASQGVTASLEAEIEQARETYSAKLATLGLHIAEHLTEHAASTHGAPNGTTLIELDEAAQLSADYIVKVMG